MGRPCPAHQDHHRLPHAVVARVVQRLVQEVLEDGLAHRVLAVQVDRHDRGVQDVAPHHLVTVAQAVGDEEGDCLGHLVDIIIIVTIHSFIHSEILAEKIEQEM